MSTVEEIEDAVRRLSSEDLAVFRAWFAQLDAAAWDRQIEEDVEVLQSLQPQFGDSALIVFDPANLASHEKPDDHVDHQ